MQLFGLILNADDVRMRMVMMMMCGNTISEVKQSVPHLRKVLLQIKRLCVYKESQH